MSRAPSTLSPTPKTLRARGSTSWWARILVSLWLPVALLALWWIFSSIGSSPFFPPLPDLLVETWNRWVLSDAWQHAVVSLRNLFLGYAMAAVIGITMGSLMWRLRLLRMAANPIIYFLYVLPAPALLPAMIAIFGIGDVRQIALITLGAIWPTLLNTLDGMRGIDSIKFDTAKALRLRGWRTYLTLVLPGASPQIAS